MPLSADDIRHAFAALSLELERQRRRAEIVVIGGAALVLLFRARKEHERRGRVLRYAGGVSGAQRGGSSGRELESSDDWLNDAAKGYFVGVSTGEILYDSPSLRVHAASTEQLLAMKLAAWRDAIDRADARLLLSQIGGSVDEIWHAVEPFVRSHERDKASYALEDLWEAMHGSS